MSSGSLQRQKEPSLFVGWILVATSWLAIMANMVVSPVLPKMTTHFKDVPSVELLISLAATLPALFVAVLAIPTGILSDRIGRKSLLFWAVASYGIVGTAPIWLVSLPQIVCSRAFVGIAEAIIITIGTVLIGDYYAGTRRERFLAAQTGTSPVIATIIAVAGGALGEASWRYPYFIYAFAFILIPFVGFFLTEPVRETESVQAESDSIERKNSTFTISGFFHDWGKLTGICLLTVFSLSAFLLVIIQLPFLLTERGVDSPAVIGKWISIVNMCIAVGALLYTIVPWKTLAKLAASYLLFCSGFLIMGLSSTWIPAVVGAIIASIGAGIILPNLISWALRTLPLEKRGKGTGAWQASSFLGQFLSPLIVLGLKKATGSLSMAVTIYGVACGILMIATLYSAIKGRYQMSKEIASEIS